MQRAQQAAAKTIENEGGKAIVIQADVSKPDEIKSLFKQTLQAFGTIDILVANSGIQRDARAVDMTLEQWNEVLSVNLTGQFLCIQEAVREFLRRGVRKEISVAAGKIICMSSVHEVIPWGGHVNYATSKGGIQMMMKSLAQELAPHRIRVNAIGPGAIRTHINTDAWKYHAGLRGPDEARSIQAHRRAGRYRASCDLSRLGYGRLRHRDDALRRRRHDLLPGIRSRRLGCGGALPCASKPAPASHSPARMLDIGPKFARTR